jgi:hypothetical protein
MQVKEGLYCDTAQAIDVKKKTLQEITDIASRSDSEYLNDVCNVFEDKLPRILDCLRDAIVLLLNNEHEVRVTFKITAHKKVDNDDHLMKGAPSYLKEFYICKTITDSGTRRSMGGSSTDYEYCISRSTALSSIFLEAEEKIFIVNDIKSMSDYNEADKLDFTGCGCAKLVMAIPNNYGGNEAGSVHAFLSVVIKNETCKEIFDIAHEDEDAIVMTARALKYQLISAFNRVYSFNRRYRKYMLAPILLSAKQFDEDYKIDDRRNRKT